MKPRDYQIDLGNRVLGHWKGGTKRVMAQLPTGGGKTFIFSSLAFNYNRYRKGRVLVLAHREELITQAAGKLEAITEKPIGIIKSGIKPNPSAEFQVASVQSLVNRLDKVGDFGLVITDEAHHAAAAGYRKIFERYEDAYHLGVTATPCRLDGAGFDDIYDAIECGPSTQSLIDMGYLCPYKLLASDRKLNTKGVLSIAGDFNLKQLGEAQDVPRMAGDIVATYKKKALGKKNIVFAINCEHSRAIVAAFRAAKIPAAHLDGNSTPDERRRVLEKFAKGKLKVLSNVGLFTEGFDLPSLEVVQIARPTESISLWLQMLGRVLRIAEGKKFGLILDHTDNWQRLGLPTRPRVWTLEGVETIPRAASVNSEGEVEEQEPVELEESGETLEVVEVDPIAEWKIVIRDLIEMAKRRGYKKGWVGYQLKGMNPPPPFEIWQYAGLKLGYHPNWANYQHSEAVALSSSAA